NNSLVKLTNPSKIPQNNKTNKNRKKIHDKNKKYLCGITRRTRRLLGSPINFKQNHFVDHSVK
ncbi:MAG: hypothetical protein LBT09_11290, partial [Planctomycetaceae bacterium]|nr:hypothetical protein [Planctomycetaceae bacterium]